MVNVTDADIDIQVDAIDIELEDDFGLDSGYEG